MDQDFIDDLVSMVTTSFLEEFTCESFLVDLVTEVNTVKQ